MFRYKHYYLILVTKYNISSIQLDDNEKYLRESMLMELLELVKCKWPQCDFMQFGSYPAGLSVFVSDIDISILGLGLDEAEKINENNRSTVDIPAIDTIVNTSSNKIDFNEDISAFDNEEAVISEEVETNLVPSSDDELEEEGDNNDENSDDSDQEGESEIEWVIDTNGCPDNDNNNSNNSNGETHKQVECKTEDEINDEVVGVKRKMIDLTDSLYDDDYSQSSDSYPSERESGEEAGEIVILPEDLDIQIGPDTKLDFNNSFIMDYNSRFVYIICLFQ